MIHRMEESIGGVLLDTESEKQRFQKK